eukprot:3500067-Rhodomonas_salina.1
MRYFVLRRKSPGAMCSPDVTVSGPDRLMRVLFGICSVTHVVSCLFWLTKVTSNDPGEVDQWQVRRKRPSCPRPCCRFVLLLLLLSSSSFVILITCSSTTTTSSFSSSSPQPPPSQPRP